MCPLGSFASFAFEVRYFVVVSGSVSYQLLVIQAGQYAKNVQAGQKDARAQLQSAGMN